MVWPTEEMAAEHYKDLSKKAFFPGLTKFFSSGPIVCMCWEGKDIIKQGRQMLGETQPLASKPGSIRGDFSIDLGRNICHGSDSPESAEHELKMWYVFLLLGKNRLSWSRHLILMLYRCVGSPRVLMIGQRPPMPGFTSKLQQIE
jgi:nucleoside-diphosphate kinase